MVGLKSYKHRMTASGPKKRKEREKKLTDTIGLNMQIFNKCDFCQGVQIFYRRKHQEYFIFYCLTKDQIRPKYRHCFV